MARIFRMGMWVCRLLIAVALTASGSGRAADPSPQPGEVQRLTAITLSLQVGSTEKDRRRVTYTPSPGWYVRSHRVHCKKKFGNSSFSVTTVPRDWGWSSEEKVTESYRTLLDLAGQSGQAGLKARFNLEQEQTLAELRKVRSTHHALIVEATAKGEGFLRGGGGLELTVTADLVFMGTDESQASEVVQRTTPE